jgi:hypothetical protein
MKRFFASLRLSCALFCAASLFAGQAAAVPLPAVTSGGDAPIVLAQSDCYSIGQQVAAQNGGTLARASQSTQGGQAVCVIVVLVPGKDGERPRRTEIVVPLN